MPAFHYPTTWVERATFGELRQGYGTVTDPGSTTFDYLLDNLKAKLEAISDLKEVIVGTHNYGGLDLQAASYFPVAGILYRGVDGVEYIDQRNIRTSYSFDVHVHHYAESPDRTTGQDMKDLEDVAVQIKTQVYSFIDDASAPCPGFRMTFGEFNIELYYKEHSQKLNTSVVSFNIMVDTTDTTA